MLRTYRYFGTAMASVALLAACSQSPDTMVSPSAAAGSSAANPDGSTLKVSAPTLVSPADGARVETRRPGVVFQNSAGRFTAVPLSYRIQVFDVTGALVGDTIVPQGSGAQTSVEAETDLGFDVEYRWRVRAEYQNEAGPWSATWSFRTPQRVVIGTGGSVGPPRNIGITEAVDIIFAIYQAGRWDIGSRSTRDQRNLYIETAVASLHYGHGKWNPRGPDSNWCIKNGGPGRPQADDVIVRCSTREAWDLVLSIGGPNPVWHTDFIGRLDSAQAVYAPSPGTLGRLP